MLAQQYKIASRDIVAEDFDGDIVVLDLSCGKYFSFSDSACGLWEALSAGTRPQALLDSAAPYSSAGLEDFLRKLLDHQLLTIREPGIEVAPAAGLIEKIRGAKEIPEIFVFDDLADLFLADPIHDVEEPVGWPVLKQN